MRIVHVFFPRSYLVAKYFIKFVEENFEDEHVFLVIGDNFGDKNISFPSNLSNVVYFSSYKEYWVEIKNYFKTSDKILYHYLSIPTAVQFRLLINRETMSKMYWVAWGADLYQWSRQVKSFKTRLSTCITYLFRKNIRHFVGIFPPDINLFKKTFGNRAETYLVSYPGGLYNPVYKDFQYSRNHRSKSRDSDTVKVLVGHSSTAILNHFETIDTLAKFKDENVHFYIPLSYGDRNYGDEVELYAKNIFGDIVTCLRRMMPLEEYLEFLGSIDIGIFNTNRQIGLGNINTLIFLGKKIFISFDSVMYEYFTSEGLDICRYEDIKNLSFEGFTSPTNMDQGKGYILRKVSNRNELIKMWDAVFKSATH